jgi:hypothetical protein
VSRQVLPITKTWSVRACSTIEINITQHYTVDAADKLGCLVFPMYSVFDLKTSPLSIHHVGLGLGLGRYGIRTRGGGFFIEGIVSCMYQGGRGFKQKQWISYCGCLL